MKKICKFIIIIICVFMAICQIEANVYAYTLDEVKELINYTIIEEGTEPEYYDILIDAKDFSNYEELPCVTTSIEDILFESKGIVDINFLNVNSSNENEDWQEISQRVQRFFKVFWYVSFAIMMTILIYIAIVIVSSSISKKTSFLPLSQIFKDTKDDKEKSPKEFIKEKKFIEQYITSFIILGLLPVIIILIILGCDHLSKIDASEESKDTIIVYVQNSEINDSTGNDLINYTFETNIEGLLQFQSQYDRTRYKSEHDVNLLMALLVNIFKLGLLAIFLIRMVIVMAFTVFAPIIILYNAYERVSGGTGILKVCLEIFLYVVFIKPIIAIVYYIFVTSKTFLISEYPAYILLPIVLITVLVIFLIISLKNKVKKEMNINTTSKKS